MLTGISIFHVTAELRSGVFYFIFFSRDSPVSAVLCVHQMWDLLDK